MSCSHAVFEIRPEQLLRVAVTGTSLLGHIETKLFKAFRWVIFYKYVNFGHFQALVQVPYKD